MPRYAALFLFFLAALSCAVAAIAQPQSQSQSLPQPDALAAELEKYAFTPQTLAGHVTAYALPDGPENATASGDLLQRLARIYVHTGAPDKADQLLAQIKTMTGRTFMLEVYAGEMAEDIAAGRDEQVLARLDNQTPMYAQIEQVQNLPAPRDIENYRHERLKDREHSFCLLAAKAYAEKGNVEMVGKIGALPDCGSNAAAIERLKRQALIARGDYVQALHLLAAADPSGGSYTPRGHSFEHMIIKKGATTPDYASHAFTFEPDLAACLPADDGSGAAADKGMQGELRRAAEKETADKADAVHFLLSRFLAATGDYAGAEAEGMKISLPDIRNRALTFLYEHYFLSGDESAAMRMAEQLGIFKDAPLEVGGFGRRDPSQWYNVTVPGARVLQEKPGPLALKIAMRFENPRTRFTALGGMLRAQMRREEERGFEGCADGLSCIIEPLAAIASEEKDEAARDYMYALLHSAKQWAGDRAGAEAYADKVVKPDRMICHYDMCTNVLTRDYHVAECEKLIRDSGDGGAAALKNLYVPSAARRLLSRYRDDAGTESAGDGGQAQRKEKRDAMMAAHKMAGCLVATGRYRTFVDDPAPLGDSADAYLKNIAGRVAYQRNLDAAVPIIARLSQTEDRYKTLAGYIKRLSGPQSPRRFEAFLAAIDAAPTLRQDYTLWWNLLDAMTRETGNDAIEYLFNGAANAEQQQRQWQAAEKILNDRPDVRAAFLKKPAYLVRNLCPLLTDALPLPADIVSWENRSREEREDLFQSCLMRLVAVKKYREALYLTDHLFASAEMNYRIRLAVLEKVLQEESLPYRQATLVRRNFDFLKEFQFSENGFGYLASRRSRAGYTRGYAAPTGCAVDFRQK